MQRRMTATTSAAPARRLDRVNKASLHYGETEAFMPSKMTAREVSVDSYLNLATPPWCEHVPR